MKKMAAILLILFASLALAAEQGIKANVELLSGTKQRAQFLGIQNDTVQLGGYIKNQFTVVRIPKDKFKSIVDEKGNDLLNPADSIKAPADSALAQAGTTSPDSALAQADSIKAPADSVAAAANSTQADSVAIAPDSTQADTIQTANTSIITSTAVLVAFEGPATDTSIQASLTALTAQLLLESGDTVQTMRRADFPDCNDDICIQNKLAQLGAKTIFFGKTANSQKPDSITIELAHAVFEDSLPEVYRAQMNVSVAAVIGESIKDNRMENLIATAKGKPIPAAKPSTSFIFIDTDPEGATISRAEKDAICKAPCTFAVTDTDKVVLNAYWNVESKLWGAQTTVRPIPGDTAKVSLKLKPVNPEIHVITTPAEAEIFPGTEAITKKSSSIGKTPDKFYLSEPGMANITLRRIGYKDTVVSFYVAPVPETRLDIELTRLTDFNEIALQQEWQHQRKMSKIGHALMAGSIAPVIVGAIFAYLGSQDYNDADDIKDELQKPGLTNGENYQNKVKENKDLVNDGDRKMIIGASLAGAGVLLFGIGLFLTF